MCALHALRGQSRWFMQRSFRRRSRVLWLPALGPVRVFQADSVRRVLRSVCVSQDGRVTALRSQHRGGIVGTHNRKHAPADGRSHLRCVNTAGRSTTDPEASFPRVTRTCGPPCTPPRRGGVSDKMQHGCAVQAAFAGKLASPGHPAIIASVCCSSLRA